MVDYKRLTFVFLFIALFLLVTETKIEKDTRKKLLSLFDIAVNESSEVGSTAPTSFLDTTENIRVGIKEYLAKEGTNMEKKGEGDNTYMGMLYLTASYIILFFKYISSFVITFYPFAVFLLYLFFTSAFFKKKDEFGLDDY